MPMPKLVVLLWSVALAGCQVFEVGSVPALLAGRESRGYANDANPSESHYAPDNGKRAGPEVI